MRFFRVFRVFRGYLSLTLVPVPVNFGAHSYFSPAETASDRRFLPTILCLIAFVLTSRADIP